VIARDRPTSLYEGGRVLISFGRGCFVVSRNFGLSQKKFLARKTLEAECLRALRMLDGYRALEKVEICYSPRSRQGANWKIARVSPTVLHPLPKQWTAFRATVEWLMARYDMAPESDSAAVERA
jgi:hypothetical protein